MEENSPMDKPLSLLLKGGTAGSFSMWANLNQNGRGEKNIIRKSIVQMGKFKRFQEIRLFFKLIWAKKGPFVTILIFDE